MRNNILHNSMNKSDLKKLSKSELIKLLLKKDKKPVPTPRTVKQIRPIPKPRKSVNQMVQDYENNIILPPLEFRDRRKQAPIPLPRTKKAPIAAPRTIIEQTAIALKGYTKSYEINIKDDKDPLKQLNSTRKVLPIISVTY